MHVERDSGLFGRMTQMIEQILSYPVNADGVEHCVADIVAWIQQAPPDGTCRRLSCLNPHSYVMARHNPSFNEALRTADWLIPDGIGIVLASRILDGRISERVTGSDIFQQVQEALNRRGGYSVFFLGGNEETLDDIRVRMAQDYPNITVAGTHAPPFKDAFSREDDQAMLRAIQIARPDVLWVGLSSPKQDLWLLRHHGQLAQLGVKFAAGIGAVFQFYTGRVVRASPFFQFLGLEWLPRLIQQPLRLWRRMGISAPIFVWHVLLARFGFYRTM